MGNKKYALISLVSNFLLMIFAVGSLIGINLEVSKIKNSPPVDGIDLRGLSVGILGIIASLLLIYGGVVLINLLLKAAHLGTGKWGFAIPCVILDVLLTVANTAILIGTVNEGEALSIAFLGVITAASILSIMMNGRSIATRNAA